MQLCVRGADIATTKGEDVRDCRGRGEGLGEVGVLACGGFGDAGVGLDGGVVGGVGG